jgi:hypothetical protein
MLTRPNYTQKFCPCRSTCDVLPKHASLGWLLPKADAKSCLCLTTYAKSGKRGAKTTWQTCYSEWTSIRTLQTVVQCYGINLCGFLSISGFHFHIVKYICYIRVVLGCDFGGSILQWNPHHCQAQEDLPNGCGRGMAFGVRHERTWLEHVMILAHPVLSFCGLHSSL